MWFNLPLLLSEAFHFKIAPLENLVLVDKTCILMIHQKKDKVIKSMSPVIMGWEYAFSLNHHTVHANKSFSNLIRAQGHVFSK